MLLISHLKNVAYLRSYKKFKHEVLEYVKLKFI